MGTQQREKAGGPVVQLLAIGGGQFVGLVGRLQQGVPAVAQPGGDGGEGVEDGLRWTQQVEGFEDDVGTPGAAGVVEGVLVGGVEAEQQGGVGVGGAEGVGGEDVGEEVVEVGDPLLIRLGFLPDEGFDVVDGLAGGAPTYFLGGKVAEFARGLGQGPEGGFGEGEADDAGKIIKLVRVRQNRKTVPRQPAASANFVQQRIGDGAQPAIHAFVAAERALQHGQVLAEEKLAGGA